MNFLYIFLIFCACITPSFQYYFGLKWGYCQHICTNSAGQNGPIQSEGYYWRDYYGVVPDDAWPAGKLDNGTTIYVGSAYDPLNRAYVVVTIYEGVDYVLNTEIKESKLTKNIQILCTQEPEKFQFVEGGYDGYSKVSSFIIRAGEHKNVGNSLLTLSSFVARSVDTGLIGQMVFFFRGIEYTKPDGKNMTSQDYELLTFDLQLESGEDTSQKQKPEIFKPNSGPFTWHVERGQGIVPNFFVQLKLGSCSSTCTDNIPRPEEMYYWRRVDGRIRLPDALIGGHDYSGNDIFLFQSYEREFNLLLTSANFSYTSAAYAKEGAKEAEELYVYLKVLSTPDKSNFKWVPVKSETVKNYKNVAVIGGGEPDGTTTYIGRATDKNAVIPGRVYIEENPRIVTSLGGYGAKTFQEFEILTVNRPKPPTLFDILFSVFNIRLITHQ